MTPDPSPDIAALLDRSHILGADPRVTNFAGGTLQTTASFAMGRTIAISAVGATIDTQSNTLTSNGTISLGGGTGRPSSAAGARRPVARRAPSAS